MRTARSSTFILAAGAVLLFAGCAQRVAQRASDGQPGREGALVGGLRDGPWVHYHANGRKQSEGCYERDVQVGEWSWWREDGTLEMRGTFRGEARDGLWTMWHPDGSVRAQGRFERGFETGLWSFHAPGGSLERRGWYDRGQMALRWTLHEPSGAVKATGHYVGGAMAGAWLVREPSGATGTVAYPLPAGVEVVEERGPDATGAGTPRRNGLLRDGKKHGLWVGSHAQGAFLLACEFVDDAPRGTASVLDREGKLVACGPVAHGSLCGTWSWQGGARNETYAAPRPRQPWTGAWSDATCTEPACADVERWLAELASPLQPAPLPAPAPHADEHAKKTLADAASTIDSLPARTQPWTEFEQQALPELVKIYGRGVEANLLGMDGYDMPIGRHVALQHPDEVAKPGDHLGKRLPATVFAAAGGGTIDLDALRGRKRALVVVLRGFGGQVCVYCTAQTKALAKEAARFAALDTEVVVVFPGPSSGLDAFLEAYERTFGKGEKPPYKLAYDADMKLVDGLGIVDNIAVPSVLLLDEAGLVRWSHVAKDLADRPSATQILRQIEALPRR